jgi:hypothetical protein
VVADDEAALVLDRMSDAGGFEAVIAGPKKSVAELALSKRFRDARFGIGRG